MSDRPENLHQRLRSSTRPLHDDLEEAVAIERQVASLAGYAGYLRRLLALHLAVERRLEAFDFRPLGFDYRSRRQSRLLEADLSLLGLSPVPAPIEQPVAPAFTTLEEALGCVYVTEGSALGARAILPQIERALRVDRRRGASYFAGFGEDGKAIWRACLEAINAIDSSSRSADCVVDGACATFAMFRQWLPSPAERSTLDAVALS